MPAPQPASPRRSARMLKHARYVDPRPARDVCLMPWPSPTLRDDRTAPIDRRELSEHERVRVVGFLAHILEELGAFLPLQAEVPGPGRRVGAGIVDRQVVL